MDLEHLSKVLFLLFVMYFPSLLLADEPCTVWALCKYMPDPDNPRNRYLSLSNSSELRTLDNIMWYEQDVAGRENEYGQAAVCIYGPVEDKALIEEVTVDIGCEVLTTVRGQGSQGRRHINDILIAPYQIYWNERLGKIAFADGTNGRNPPRGRHEVRIHPKITDPIVRPVRAEQPK